MTLFEKLESIMGLGWKVKFYSFGFQFYIEVSREIVLDGEEIKRTSAMPLNDHFHESRIVECIDWSIEEINKEIVDKEFEKLKK